MLTPDTKHLQYANLLKEAKNPGDFVHTKILKIALLGDVATQHLALMVRALFAREHIKTEIYEGGFGATELEVFNPDSALYRFVPDIIVVLHATHGMRDRYHSLERSALFAVEASARAVSLWDAIRSHSEALVIQSNVALPYERLFGQYDHYVPGSLSMSLVDFNQKLSEKVRLAKNIRVLDLEYLASYVGRKDWFDEKMWVIGKSLCAPAYLPHVAQAITDIALSHQGKGVKCLILDLDNTLWGGVVGDDGLEGIQLGHGGEGEAFHTFQVFLLALKNRGIILAVCSKNEKETALKVFREHPDMVLREKDIAVFMANWQNKADNIKEIQRILNIGFDSMVFLDDNPFERNLVRDRLPEVIVPELPEDPADYVKALSELNLFEVASFSEEDAKRADMYREEASRVIAKASYASIDDYLASLAMEGWVARFDEFHLPRIAQLILRSNQFNLTTRRYTDAECAKFMQDEKNYYPFYVTLKDTFGDYGLVGLAILKRDGIRAFVDTWLMSCRVLARGVEELMLNHAVAQAKAWGCTELGGEYVPTTKNMMVKDFYPRFGFELVSDEDGHTVWRLPTATYEDKKIHITLV